MTEEELRALNDPWINWFLSEQARLHKEMATDKLVHMAQSFGSAQTEGATRYKTHSLELEGVNAQLMIYALGRGYLDPKKLDLDYYNENEPPQEKR